MDRVEVVGERDEALAEWEGRQGVVRGPDGGILDCGNWGRAFEKEFDVMEQGLRGGGSGASSVEHAGSAEAWERAEAEYCRQVEAEILARLPVSARVKGARVERGGWVGDHEKDRRQELRAVAWNRNRVVIGSVKLELSGGLRRVLEDGVGRQFLGVLVDRIAVGGVVGGRGAVLG